MSRGFRQIEFDFRTKGLLILLFLVASILWAKILFFNNKTKADIVENELNSEQKSLKREKKESNLSRFDLEKIYGSEKNKQNNPFTAPANNRVEFVYESQSESSHEPLDLAEIDSDLKLQGVINQSRAIVNYKGQTVLVKIGTEVGGYKVVDINSNQVTYLKEEKKYISNLYIDNK